VIFGEIGLFAKNDILVSILEKVKNIETAYLNSIMFSNTSYKYSQKLRFDFPHLFEKVGKEKPRLSGGSSRYLASSVFENVPELFSDFPSDDKNRIKIIGRKNGQRTEMYIEKQYLVTPSNFEKYKVFISSSNGTGAFGETLTMPFIGEPNVGATETYLSMGEFETREVAENLIKYIKTKFARAMLGTLKVTQGNKNANVWSNVPCQNFTNFSDVDWSQSVSKIDQQLYAKYNLDDTEIEFLEANVKAME
jgi:hypothetical protein